MQIKLPLDEMSKEEKIRLMEILWMDLTKSEEEITSPSWHEDVLKEREEKIRTNQESYKDWESVKKELLKNLL